MSDYSPSNPKYPQVKVRLTGVNGNAWAIMAKCSQAARKAKVPQKELDAIMEEAMSGDYDHLLQTMMKNFDVS